MTRTSGLFFVAIVTAVLTTGCGSSVVFGDKVWIEHEQELAVPAEALTDLSLKTHNGGVVIDGDEESTEISVMITRRAGADNADSAEECLKAIEIVSETKGSTHKLSWKWNGIKAPDWNASVSFDVEMPASLAATVKTHNGGVVVTGVDGRCSLTTHNGGIKVVSGDASPLVATTHNGGIKAETSGSQVKLNSHNGGIKLTARNSTELGGEISTHNGGVTIKVGPQTSAKLFCATARGRLTCDAGVVNEKTKRRLTATLGKGGPSLDVSTHNGSVNISDGA